MNRTLIGVGIAFALMAFLGVVLVWFLAFGSDLRGSETVETDGLSGPAALTIGSGFEVDAGSEEDAYYVLGFAQAQEHPWTMNLLRQTALGRLSEWFGDSTGSIDAFTRSLGFAAGAIEAVKDLPEEDRRVLASYSRGISDGFSGRSVIMDDHLVLLDVMPEPWEIWHAVAVERLYAWLAEPPQRPATTDTAFNALSAFQRGDESLREWLHLHGFEHSAAWAVDDTTSTRVVARFVYGASALALYVPVRLSWPGTDLVGVSLLGTPFLPLSVGAGGTSVTLASSHRLARNRFDAGFPDSVSTGFRYERIATEAGAERLVEVAVSDDHLFFSPTSFEAGTSAGKRWGSLRWTGLQPQTDWPAWRSRARVSAGTETGPPSAFELLEGHGLFVGPAGNKTIYGRPAVAERSRNGTVFLATHPVGSYAAQRIVAGGADTDIASTWAEANVRTALGALQPDSTFTPMVREAIDYLRNWDFKYDLSSIGATLFDAWMGAFTSRRVPFPSLVISGDSLVRAETREALERSLLKTVDSLRTVAGPDLARWRLEAFRKSERFHPVWSCEPLRKSLPSLDPQRYGPLSIQSAGHPTTVSWGTGLFDYPHNSPAHVIASATSVGKQRFSFRPDYYIGSGIIARHVVSAPDEHPSPFPIDEETILITFRTPSDP